MSRRILTRVPLSSLTSSLRDGWEQRLDGYLDGISDILRTKRRREGFAMYACGIFGDGDRKSVEPIAARACGAPDRVEATHRKLLRFIGESDWDDEPIREYATRYAVEQMQQHQPIKYWIVDDTGFLKQGAHSPGVQRQYTGSAGKTTNCQVAVSLSVATDHAHTPVDMRLYLPQSWASDRKRRLAAKIPEELEYSPKWKLALGSIERALDAGIPKGVVLADADYGNKVGFRDRLDELGLSYAVAIKKNSCVRAVVGCGKQRRIGERKSVEELAFDLDPKVIRKVTWKEGTKSTMSAHFALLRVEPMPVGPAATPVRQEQWLIIEWPSDSHLPTKFALATLPRRWSRKRIIRVLKERWRTERAYQDLKGQLGLDHFEGRSYKGWNHHVTIVLACYAFLVAEQARGFPPSGARAPAPTPNVALRRAA